MNVVEMTAVEMSYGARRVLKGVDLQVRRGEVLCILGPNGAGKTTTVEILEGFRHAAAGTVRVLGRDPASQPVELRERVGVVLQECGFPRHLRVGEVLDASRGYYARPRPLAELLELVELTGEARTPIGRLSGGQRRRLDFALALAGGPELVFLDEPTTGFDPEARRRCWTAIDNLRALDTTIVLTTHYLDEAERLADRVAVLVGGTINACGSPDELARATGARTRVAFTLPDAAPLPPAMSRVGSKAIGLVDEPLAALRSLSEWATANGVDALDDLELVPPRLEDTYLRLVDGVGVGA